MQLIWHLIYHCTHIAGIPDPFDELDEVVLVSGPIHTSGVQCRGNETHVFECSVTGEDLQNCDHLEDVAVRCQGGYICLL